MFIISPIVIFFESIILGQTIDHMINQHDTKHQIVSKESTT